MEPGSQEGIPSPPPLEAGTGSRIERMRDPLDYLESIKTSTF